jgi:LuxR family maltose regulon positive regulatory protein
VSSGKRTSVNGQLLATKFYAPRVRQVFVTRDRLSERLSEGMERRLTLISAPAGFGKTTLLSQWLITRSDEPWPIGWLSLDENDNDPSRFWTYFVAALRKLHPDVGGGAMTMLRSPQTPPVEHLLTPLINDVSELPALFPTCVLHSSSLHHSGGGSQSRSSSVPPGRAT